MEMTPKQEIFLDTLSSKVKEQLENKFRKGQAEHGGDLKDRDVIYDAIDESLDMIVYTYTINLKRHEALSKIEGAIAQLHGKEEYESTKQLLIDAVELLTRKAV